ncbi:hypothetical protein [EBPR siphovirus 2]|nr:hypothetical protein [EBPR siphovirus 2]
MNPVVVFYIMLGFVTARFFLASLRDLVKAPRPGYLAGVLFAIDVLAVITLLSFPVVFGAR